MTTPVLAFGEVTRRFPDGLREIAVLDGVSFELYDGETVGVLASRGAGKTTLLRVVAGLDPPDAGQVLWQGSDLAAMSADERARIRRHGGIALARGDWRPTHSRTVLEHVAMPLYSEGLSSERAEVCALRALETVQSSGLGYAQTDRLGLLERVHVELARAIVREPALLLVDEPAVLPQPGEARTYYSLLHSLPSLLGLSLLIASEEVSALRGASRVLNLDNGRLHSTDSRRTVIRLSERRSRRSGAAR